ncbi:hypothetical protein [uncultured Robinsoniella sp.]|uniref:hypothetical protein n=1 Tax=uncultured Robinsoniella sp. TaxID=904190 RepID=UPI00374F53F8
MINTLSYVLGNEEEIKVGNTYYFGQIWNSDGDGEDLLESGTIAIWDSAKEAEYVLWFNTVEENEDLLQTLVKITNII